MEVIANVNMKALQTFLVVAQEGSFRRAAEKLHRSHSAVSAQIMQIEAQIGVALFERTTRSVKLTVEGEHLRDSARKAFYELHLGLRRIREEKDARLGQLSLACSSHMASIRFAAGAYRVRPSIPRYRRDRQRADVTDLYQALRQKEVDFAVGPQELDDAFDLTTIMVEPLQALIPLAVPRRRRRHDNAGRIGANADAAANQGDRSSQAARCRSSCGGVWKIPTPYQFIQAETIVATGRSRSRRGCPAGVATGKGQW